MLGDISFLLDTGADKSVVMPLDGGRIGIDYNQLGNTIDTIGIGGVSTDYVESAILTFFEEDGALHVYAIEIHIAPPCPDIMRIPSLIGRVVMNHWSIMFDKTNDLIEARVLYADVSIPISPPTSPPTGPER